MKRSYFWRVKLYEDGNIEEIDADFVDVRGGTLLFMNKAGVEVIYAAGTWEKVLKVSIKEKTENE